MDTLNKSCLSHFCIPVTKTLLYTTLSLDAEETWVGPVLCGHVLIWNLWILLLKEKHQAKVRNLLKVSASLYSSFYVCNCQSLFRELTSYWMELIMQILGKSHCTLEPVKRWLFIFCWSLPKRHIFFSTQYKLVKNEQDYCKKQGWEGDARGRRYGDICVHIADSLCCTAETNTTL